MGQSCSNQCNFRDNESGNVSILSTERELNYADNDKWGLDSDEGCTLEFHYHQKYIYAKNISLNIYDKILRKAAYPLFLLDINYIWEQLDTIAPSASQDSIPYSTFTSHFRQLREFK